MAGPKEPMYYEGKRVHWRISAAGGYLVTFAIQSMAENVKITLKTMPGLFHDVNGLLAIVEKIIAEDQGKK